MTADLTHLVGPALASAFAAKGYDTLTPVQEAVLDEALEGRDLRITSQTGSGKTIAIGFAVRDLLDDLTAQYGGVARPRVLILAPTRELAKQVADELTWLYAPLRVRVAAVTGGSGYLDQKRALSSNPAVVVATPGRLRDALERQRLDPSALAAVVLDEADSMLDLGFREDLEAILAMLPAERRSHLVSATFSRDVVALADRFQKDPVHVQGTRLGEAHADIEHVVHLVEPFKRVDALVNLLLSDEDAKSLVFARTRRSATEPWRRSGKAASRRSSPPTSPPVASTSATSRGSSRSSRPPTWRRTRTGVVAPGEPASRGRACCSCPRRTTRPSRGASRGRRSRIAWSPFRAPRPSSARGKRSSSPGSRGKATARPSIRTPCRSRSAS